MFPKSLYLNLCLLYSNLKLALSLPSKGFHELRFSDPNFLKIRHFIMYSDIVITKSTVAQKCLENI